jgi:hypothetical protein
MRPPGSPLQPHLSAALEAALLRALAASWDEINQTYFRGKLGRPVLALHDGPGRLGQWSGGRRQLSLSRRVVWEQPWGVVLEVLKHEVAHQFVDEVLQAREETAHGPAFESVCRQHGIDAAASGLPEATAPAADEHPVLRRIARLLALAGSPNLNEAQAAMGQAQRLMLKHNIEAAAATAQRGFQFRCLGVPRRRLDGAEQILASILADHFFVEVIWVPSYAVREGRQGRVLEVCGTPANLEVATYVHGFLTEAAARLWRDHKAAQRLEGDRERRRFVLGVMMGFAEKLRGTATDNRREGLVWLGDPELTAYLRRRHPHRRGGGRIGVRQTASYEQGRRAGRQIVLHRPVHARVERGGLLPSGR